MPQPPIGSTLRMLSILALIVAAPAFAQAPPATDAAPRVAPFSSGRAGATFPAGWLPIKINEQKKPTLYDLVDDQGKIVLHAAADGAASLLGVHGVFDIRAAPVIAWRWKISRLIESADNAVASKEDSPVRIVLEFDGDKSKLSVGERCQMATGKLLAGHDL